jgi:DNA polymerase-1
MIIIDGNSIAVRAYHTDPFTFFSMTHRHIRHFEPAYTIFCFDDPWQKSWRYELYPDYKAHREENPSRDYWIKALIGAFRKFNVPLLISPEADDIIASAVRKFQPQVEQIYIYTSDSDLWQLAGDQVAVISRRKGHDLFLISETDVMAELGVRPAQIPQYKAIVGDKSDNIPGLKGFGPKRALAILDNEPIGDRVPKATMDLFNSSTRDLKFFSYLVHLVTNLNIDQSLCDFTTPSNTILSDIVAHLKQTETLWRSGYVEV